MKLTKQEELAIKLLKKVVHHWPESLWLYAANGTLCVMRKENGQRVMRSFGGGVDPDYEVDTIDIECDGGDW